MNRRTFALAAVLTGAALAVTGAQSRQAVPSTAATGKSFDWGYWAPR